MIQIINEPNSEYCRRLLCCRVLKEHQPDEERDQYQSKHPHFILHNPSRLIVHTVALSGRWF
jgi:hypothetical protein